MDSKHSIEESLARLISLYESLAEALAEERAGLAAQDLTEIAKAAEAKAAACGAIETITAELGPVPLSEQIVTLATARQAPAAELLSTLREIAADNRQSNITNGKILHRSQHVVRELIGLLSGVGPDTQLLYAASGQTQATASSGAIAEA